MLHLQNHGHTCTSAMRHLVQLLIPALILIGVIYVVMRSRQQRSEGQTAKAGDDGVGDSDKGTFILILIIGALVVVGAVFALLGVWDPVP